MMKKVQECGPGAEGVRATRAARVPAAGGGCPSGADRFRREACILGVPCVTLRDNTERPETLDVGANVLAGVSSERIMDGARQILEAETGWKNPFGDGRAGERILQYLSDSRESLDDLTNF